jgi:hypothetical protein
VLVLHGKNERGQRLETRINASLTVETDDGVVVLEGISFANSEGSDVLFDIRGNFGRLFGIPLSQYRLTIHSVEYRIPGFTVPISLMQAVPEQDYFLEMAETFVRSAFMSRLDYKSQRISRNEIYGFSQELLNDRSLMRHYVPVGGESVPMYTAEVVSGVFTEDWLYIAVVEDEWVLGVGEGMTYLRNTHQVTAMRRPDNTWVIIRDEIIN